MSPRNTRTSKIIDWSFLVTEMRRLATNPNGPSRTDLSRAIRRHLREQRNGRS